MLKLFYNMFWKNEYGSCLEIKYYWTVSPSEVVAASLKSV